MPTTKEMFLVTGTVIDEKSKEAACAFEVRLFDKDHKDEQHLGTAITDSQGRFRFTFELKDFIDSYFQIFGIRVKFEEFKPDIFFRVYYQGILIADLKDQVIRNLKDKEVEVTLEIDMPEEAKAGNCIEQNVYLKIEKILDYSPVNPAPGHSYTYQRDCFRRAGHEDGTIPNDEAELRKMTAVVYRPYTDNTYTSLDPTPMVAADIAEPPVDRRLPGVVIYTRPGRRLRIHVYNDDDVAHSLHMHGIQYGIDSDGAYPFGIKTDDEVRSDQICPGETYIYQYDVTNEMTGAWVFHDHYKNIGENARLGVIGGLVVRDPCWPQADYEVPFFMHKVSGKRPQPVFDSRDIPASGTFSRTFDTAGTFEYECIYHPMFGTVNVQAGAPATATVSILDNTFNPPGVAIAPGGTVTWTNNGLATHTVTESGSSNTATSYAVNGRSFAGNTPVIEVESGKRIRWYLFNLDFDMEWHNFHPHASHWEFGGQHLDNRSIGPAEAFVVDTVAPPVLLPPCEPKHLKGRKKKVKLAATFPVHCHVEPHVMAGMVALLRVRQEIAITKAYENALGYPLPLDTGTFECPIPDENLCIDTVDEGSWTTLPDTPIFAVHGAILNTGKVMIWSGHAELGPGYGLETALYNPVTNSYNTVPFSDPEDLFCAGHTFLPDGRLVAGGGANQGQVRSTHIFDPITETWTRLNGGQLRDFRWYPTLVTMGDGRIAIVSGTSGGTAGTVEDIEVLDLSKPAPAPGTGVFYWDLVTGSEKSFSGLYPGLHWLPSGDMFFTRTGWNSHIGLGDQSSRFTFSAELTGSWTDFAPMTYPDRKEGCSTIIIDDTGATPVTKIFVAGGRADALPSIRNCEIIDVSNPTATPGWQETAQMTHARIGTSVVVLPNGKIMVIGGRQTPGRFDNAAVFVYECEIYDPNTDTWAITPPMTFPRQYHSVALLLPDGRIFAAGGVDTTGGTSPGYDPGDNQMTAEIYAPEYLNSGTRPEILGAPESTTHGSIITVNSNFDAVDIGSASLVAPGAMTHHTDTNQRYIKLEIVSRTASSLDVRIPTNGNIAPPGYYMLHIVDNDGVPSEAHFIQIT